MTIAELVIASDLRHAIERQFRGEGIVIPYPQQMVHLQEKRESRGTKAKSPATVPSNDHSNRIICNDQNAFVVGGRQSFLGYFGCSR